MAGPPTLTFPYNVLKSSLFCFLSPQQLPRFIFYCSGSLCQDHTSFFSLKEQPYRMEGPRRRAFSIAKMKINKAARLFWRRLPLPRAPGQKGPLALLCLTRGFTQPLGRSPWRGGLSEKSSSPRGSLEDPRELEKALCSHQLVTGFLVG